MREVTVARAEEAASPPPLEADPPAPAAPTSPRRGGLAPSAGRLDIPALILLGLCLRAWLLLSPHGGLNSDEAQTPIQARELFRGHAWLMVPGTPYGGNAEAWLDAPLAAIFGLSATRSKLETAVLWMAAGLVLARSVRHRGRGAAAVAFGVVWLPSAALVLLSTRAYPGYAAGLLATCCVVALARPFLDDPPIAGRGRTATTSALAWRAGATGALAGLAVWQHPLYGYVCATTLAALAWRQRRQLLGVLGPLVAGGLVALMPLVIANLRNGFQSLHPPVDGPPPYLDRVRAWVTDLYPRASGAKSLGPDWVAGRPSQVLAVLVLALLAATCVAVLRWSPLSGKVAAGTLLMAPFTVTVMGHTSYTRDARYAAMVLPAAAVALAHGVGLLRGRWVASGRAPLAVAAWSVLAVVIPVSTGVVPLDEPKRLDQLVEFLDSRQVTAARADFWVAYRIVVDTDERIAASPLAPIKFDRYEQRVRRADAAGTSALVLETKDVAAYRAGTSQFMYAPWNGYLQFRGYPSFEVSMWTVFLPPDRSAIGTAGAAPPVTSPP